MKTIQTKQEKVIARIIAKNFKTPKEASKMVAEYWELCERRGCETVSEFADDITWFAAV